MPLQDVTRYHLLVEGTAWDTWKAFDNVTRAFCALATTPSADAIDDWMEPLERFVVLMYDRTSSQESVNQARKELFTKKDRAIDGLPPTQAALKQHTKRAAYQAGHCWGQVMVAAPELPSPGDWGWKKRWMGRPLCQKQPRPVMNSSAVDVKRGAEGIQGSTSVHSPLPMWWTVFSLHLVKNLLVLMYSFYMYVDSTTTFKL